jgi:hypothetical protein
VISCFSRADSFWSWDAWVCSECISVCEAELPPCRLDIWPFRLDISVLRALRFPSSDAMAADWLPEPD